MRKVFIFLSALLISIVSVQAGSLTEAPEYFGPEPALVYGPPVGGSSYAFCRAETVCANGLPVGCYAYGRAQFAAACEWLVVPGRYVECRGYNDLGVWAVSWFNC